MSKETTNEVVQTTCENEAQTATNLHLQAKSTWQHCQRQAQKQKMGSIKSTHSTQTQDQPRSGGPFGWEWKMVEFVGL